MTVAELQKMLKKYDDNELVRIKVKIYSDKKEKIIDTFYEDIQYIENIVCINNEDEDYVNLEITLYQD